MDEGQNETKELLGSLEIQAVDDELTGLSFYYCIDHDDLDPNGEPVMYELTATEYLEMKERL